MMPGMDGCAFRREQRAIPALSDLPVVVVSPSRDLARAAQALEPAAAVAKPSDLSTPLATVEHSIARADPGPTPADRLRPPQDPTDG